MFKCIVIDARVNPITGRLLCGEMRKYGVGTDFVQPRCQKRRLIPQPR